jgi:hypothetical protein
MVRKDHPPKLGGEGGGGVEVDAMYHGGRRKNESGGMLGGNAANKTMVMGVVERKGGRIVARIAPRLTIPATNELLREYVMRKTMIFTDDTGACNFSGCGHIHSRSYWLWLYARCCCHEGAHHRNRRRQTRGLSDCIAFERRKQVRLGGS